MDPKRPCDARIFEWTLNVHVTECVYVRITRVSRAGIPRGYCWPRRDAAAFEEGVGEEAIPL